MATALAEAKRGVARWNTLERLKISRAGLIALDGLLLIAIVLGTRMHQSGMKTVGKDAAPSIIAAQHIKTALAAMDVSAVNELLGRFPQARERYAYEEHRFEASKALISAAENITYGDAERAPIETLLITLGAYEPQIQRAVDLHLQDNTVSPVEDYLLAARTMDGTLLPSADTLDKANNAELERTYQGEEGRSLGMRAFILGAGTLEVVALIGIQIFLSLRMRRTINPLLLIATLLTLGWTLHALSAMGHEQKELKIAKQDAFTSIHALWRARAVAYKVQGDEGRLLLDPKNASEHERRLLAGSAALAKCPAQMSIEQVVAKAASGEHVEGFSGYLADELNNITFSGERQAAIETLTSWGRFIQVDTQLRKLAHDGLNGQALALARGGKEGQADWTFGQFDAALTRTLEINQRAFKDAVAKGFAALDGLEYETFGVAFVLAILVFFGLAPRIREYE